MNELLDWMEYIEDVRQEKKVRHKLKDIIVIVLFATLAIVDDWVEMMGFLPMILSAGFLECSLRM